MKKPPGTDRSGEVRRAQVGVGSQAPPHQLGSLGSAVSSPAGSGAEPQSKSNLVHFSLKIRHLVATILMIFLRILPKCFCGPTPRGPQELGGGSLNRLNLRFLRLWVQPSQAGSLWGGFGVLNYAYNRRTTKFGVVTHKGRGVL